MTAAVSASTVGLCRACFQASKLAPPPCVLCGATQPLAPLANPGGLSEEQLILLINDQSLRTEDGVQHRARWVGDFHRRVRVLVDGSSKPDPDLVGFFWIRLHQILGEMPALLDGPGLAIFDQATDEQKARLRPYLRVAAGRRVALAAIQAISDSMSREDHIFADWFRQRLSHLQQRAYTIQVRTKGGTDERKEASKVQSLGADVTVEERDDAIARTMAVSRDDETEAARIVARKIAEPAKRLFEAWRHLIAPEIWK